MQCYVAVIWEHSHYMFYECNGCLTVAYTASSAYVVAGDQYF